MYEVGYMCSIFTDLIIMGSAFVFCILLNILLQYVKRTVSDLSWYLRRF
jgi:hypothetical protein